MMCLCQRIPSPYCRRRCQRHDVSLRPVIRLRRHPGREILEARLANVISEALMLNLKAHVHPRLSSEAHASGCKQITLMLLLCCQLFLQRQASFSCSLPLARPFSCSLPLTSPYLIRLLFMHVGVRA